MNGVHDMGGMQGLGSIQYEENEPVFHASWEGRTFALDRAMRAWRKWNLDAFRHRVELITAAEYLRMSYYERWLAALAELLVASGLVTRAELESGTPAAGSPKATPPLTAEMVPQSLNRGIPPSRDPSVVACFNVGQGVRARNLHPAGHTRLPRYARGKAGKIVRDHGVYDFPDTNAHSLGVKRQHVYSVVFSARELWGEESSVIDSVYLDLWEDYLERV